MINSNLDQEYQINHNNNSIRFPNSQPNRPLNVSNDQNLILSLQKIWTDEKFSKELLKYQENFISEVYFLVEAKEKLPIINNSKSKDFGDIIELDIDRIKFLIKDYLRIRLSKIDKYIYLIIKNDMSHLLSKSEYDFACELYKLKKNYFYEGINKRLPDLFNDFKNYPDNEQMIVSPPSNAYVCFKSATYEPISINLRDVWEESNETLIINREDVYCLPYNLIKDRLDENKIQLL